MKFKKILITTILITGIVISGYHVSAQTEKNECSVCNVSAEEFDMLLNMTNELVNSIKTMWKEWDYIWEYINPNRYEWTKFNPPSKKKQITNLVLKSESLITTVALLFTPSKFAWAEDYFFGFIIMFKNKVFPREYKKILDMEGKISDKIYELWLWWWYYTKVNDSNRKDINKILAKYKSKWILLDYYLEDDLTYKNIVDQANEITSSLKSFLATKWISKFRNFNWRITLNINFEKIKKMRIAYECSNDCNTTLNNFSEDIRDIKENTKQWLKTDWQIIRKSIKKFKEEIWNIGTKNLFKNTIKINWSTWFSKDLRNIWELVKYNKLKIKENETIQWYKTVLSDSMRFLNVLFKYFLWIKDSKDTSETFYESELTDNPDTIEILNSEYNLIRDSMLSTIEKHQESIEYAVITETKNTNYYFEYLSKLINRNIDIAKDFKKNLQDSANLQCSK